MKQTLAFTLWLYNKASVDKLVIVKEYASVVGMAYSRITSNNRFYFLELFKSLLLNRFTEAEGIRLNRALIFRFSALPTFF